MRASRKILPLAIGAALAGLAGSSFGAGFQLMEQNASGLGAAFAGTAALAEDASTVFFNPAGISRLGKQNVAVVMSAIGPSAEFSGGAVSANGAPAALANAVNNGAGNGGDAGSWAFVPAMYYAMNITPMIGLGIGVNAPFGLKTDYDFPWRGQTLGIMSELKTMDINPVISFKISEAFSVGVGFSYQKAEATLTSATAAPGLGAARIAQLEGDDWGWGYNLGALWQVSPTVRLGFNYRSEVDHTLEGMFTISGLLATPAQADLTLPSVMTLSGAWNVTPAWQLMADISRTGWDTFENLTAINSATGAIITTTPENWENTLRYSLGTAYQLNQQWKLRFGVAYDESPVPDFFRTVRVPDNDRTWLSFGGQWKFGQSGAIDFGYTHVFVKDSSICYNIAGAPCGTTPQVQLRGNYENSVDIVSVQYSQAF